MFAVNAPKTIIRKGPKASEKSEKSISAKPLIIRKPTKMRAGPLFCLEKYRYEFLGESVYQSEIRDNRAWNYGQ